MTFENFISDLVNAVSNRKSVRNFLLKLINEDIQRKIQDFLKILEPPFTHSVDISLHEIPDENPVFIFKGMNKAGKFASMSTTPTIENQAKLGFIGELFILYCESLGLSTCWFGHFKKNNTYKIVYDTVEKQAPKQIFCITPIGFRADKKGLMEKITTKIFSTKKKGVEENLHEDSLKKIPEKIKYALELACKAPSALNKQFWYFKVTDLDSEFEVEISKPIGYKHLKWKYTDIDIGTCAAHFWLGLKHQHATFNVNIQEQDKRIVWIFKIAK